MKTGKAFSEIYIPLHRSTSHSVDTGVNQQAKEDSMKTMSDQELAICRNLGIDPKDYLASKKADQEKTLQQQIPVTDDQKEKICQAVGITLSELE